MSILTRWRAHQIQHAQDTLDDAEYHLRKWGFGMTPSERRKEGERIERLQRRLDRLTANESSSP